MTIIRVLTVKEINLFAPGRKESAIFRKASPEVAEAFSWLVASWSSIEAESQKEQVCFGPRLKSFESRLKN